MSEFPTDEVEKEKVLVKKDNFCHEKARFEVI